MPPAPVYIGGEIYRRSSYGPGHPLAVPRVSTCTDLCAALGWFVPGQVRAAPMASVAELTRFHTEAYIQALIRTEAAQRVTEEDRQRHRIGAEGNPVYPEIFRRPATSAGGVLLGAALTASGGIVHCPGGGTHHGRANRASGFCYVNDPVLGLMAWLDQGLDNLVYLDIDAHHGDGVQDAFAGDPRVLTISLHEEGRWPFTGLAHERAAGSARNFPVPAGCNDSEFAYVMAHAVLPIIHDRAPQAIMLQAGADGLAEDPLAKMDLSNNTHIAVVEAIRAMAPRLLVLGGGGYNPYTVGRCWAAIWASLAGYAIPPILPAPAQDILRSLRYNRAAGRDPPEHWITTLRDTPRPGLVRDAVKRLAGQAGGVG